MLVCSCTCTGCSSLTHPCPGERSRPWTTWSWTARQTDQRPFASSRCPPQTRPLPSTTSLGATRARLLWANAILIDHGYTVGRYVSLEQAVSESADTYYQALLESTHGWHEGACDPWPWLGYFTSVLATAYAVFADRAAAATTPGTKQQRVRDHILHRAPVTFRLADIRTAVPGVSDQTIRLALEQLRSENRVRADGTGRSATWTRLENAAPSE